MDPRIAGIGTALPEHSASQADAVEVAKDYQCRSAEQERLLRVFYRRTGVKRRASVIIDDVTLRHPAFFPPPADENDRGPGTDARMRRYLAEAPPLALAAAGRALADSGLAPERIGQVVTVSCTGFFAPGFDVALIKGLGLPASTGRTHLGFMGCHGALNGLRVAAAMVRAEPSSAVLLCALELCSLHFQYGWDPEQVVANALFADGAGALVVAGGDGEPAPWTLAGSRSWLLPGSDDAMTWRIGDHGFVMTLSAQVPDLIGEHLRPALEPWLASHGLTLAEVPTWAVHPGGPRILTAVTDALGLPADDTAVSREVLAGCGNMSSPTIIFILERLRALDAPRPCVALGFGPGLTAEVALLR